MIRFKSKFGEWIGCAVFHDSGKELAAPTKDLYITDDNKLIIVSEGFVIHTFSGGEITAFYSSINAGDVGRHVTSPEDFDNAIIFYGIQKDMQLYFMPEHLLKLVDLIREQNPDAEISTNTRLNITDGVATGIAYLGEDLYIPAEVTNLPLKGLSGYDPEVIEVERGNEAYYSERNCLIELGTRKLIFGCSNSEIPEKRVITIGSQAFASLSRARGLQFDIPKCIERMEAMALAIPHECGLCEFSFEGSPELEIGVFGTKAEAAESDDEVFGNMPEDYYKDPESIIVKGEKGSSVEAYCSRFSIPFAVAE